MMPLGSLHEHIERLVIWLTHQIIKVIISHLNKKLKYIVWESVVIVVLLYEFFFMMGVEMKRFLYKFLIDVFMVMVFFKMFWNSYLFGEFMALTETFVLIDNDLGGCFLWGSIHIFKIYCIQLYLLDNTLKHYFTTIVKLSFIYLFFEYLFSKVLIY